MYNSTAASGEIHFPLKSVSDERLLLDGELYSSVSGSFYGTAVEGKIPSKVCWGSASSTQPHEDSEGYAGIWKMSYGKQLHHNGFSNKDRALNAIGTMWLWGCKNHVYYMIWHTWALFFFFSFSNSKSVSGPLLKYTLCSEFVTEPAKYVTEHLGLIYIDQILWETSHSVTNYILRIVLPQRFPAFLCSYNGDHISSVSLLPLSKTIID